MATLNFDTRKQYSKIYQKGSFTLTVSGASSQTTQTIVHGLGYVPMCKIWFTNHAGLICPASSDIFPSMFTDFNSSSGQYEIYYWVDTTTLTVTFDRLLNAGGTDSTTVYYRIYYDVVN